ncbi:MAG: SCO family protein [Gammaproteobacteria bacterium]|nr:SCO family protein [Gammaproteobacteria bacterium]
MAVRVHRPSCFNLPWAIFGLLCTAIAVTQTARAEEQQVLAPGYHNLEFDAPPPGSYRLPPIGPAVDGEVLDEHGNSTRLHEMFDGRYVVLSFIYSSCDDVNGCPLATYVLYRLYQAMQKDPALSAQMRLISLSFDPQNDTPEMMRLYGATFAGDDAEWRFLTTASNEALEPILRDYGQSVSRVFGTDGKQTSQISHVLRVFLIDPERRIRNIYSVSFLHPDLVLADVRTLMTETEPDEAGPAPLPLRTRELLVQSAHPPLGLPPMQLPEGQELTAARVDLGRKLFFDRRLSANETLSCAMCHIPEQGFTNNAMARAVGMEGRSLRRNASSLYNLAWADPLHVDGRERFLDTLVWGEFLNRKRMGNAAVAMVLDKLLALPDYDGMFETAFDGRGADMVTVGVAMASYLRTQVSGNSAFDRWRFGGEDAALAPEAQRGFELFTGRAGCASCHRVESDHAVFSDGQLHDTGIGWHHSMRREPPSRWVELAPGVRVELDMEALKGTEERPFNDLGLYEVTQDPADRWKFRTPGLRNVALTAPYMHDGSIRSLEEVVEHYDRGGHAHEALDSRMRPLGLTDDERAELVAFLRSLTGDNIALLEADAAAAPVGVPAGKGAEP